MMGPEGAAQVAAWVRDLEADLAAARAEVAALADTLAWARRLEARAVANGDTPPPARRRRLALEDARHHLAQRDPEAVTVAQVAAHFAVSTVTARARLVALVAAGTAVAIATDLPGAPRLYRLAPPPGTPPEAPRTHTPGPGPRTVPVAAVPGTSHRAGVGRRVARARARRGRR